MFSSPISKKSLIITFILSIIILLSLLLTTYLNPHTTIIFCDVGQGDAAYIRIKNKIDVLIDTGPNRKILDCLGKHMPFYDRTIEYVILTHEQKDHTGGLEYIKSRYQIVSLIRENNIFKTAGGTPLRPDTSGLRGAQQNLRVYPSVALAKEGKKLVTESAVNFEILWPTEEFYTRWCKNKKIENENTCALILLYQEGNTSILFTSDTSSSILEKITNDNQIKNIDILKIPHHGSKYGINEKILKQLNPKLSIISVGKNNIYGHPTKEVLNILNIYHYNYKRTDEKGDIVIKFKS